MRRAEDETEGEIASGLTAVGRRTEVSGNVMQITTLVTEMTATETITTGETTTDGKMIAIITGEIIMDTTTIVTIMEEPW